MNIYDVLVMVWNMVSKTIGHGESMVLLYTEKWKEKRMVDNVDKRGNTV